MSFQFIEDTYIRSCFLDQNELGSGKVGRVGTAIVFVAVVVVVVTAAALVDSAISSTQLLSCVQVGYVQIDIGK
jgi:hypothetical protein